MGWDKYGNKYYITESGTNSQGNHYSNRDYGPDAPNQNSYHYSNKDGSYYYSNPNGSTYYNDGKGSAVYTPPDSSNSDNYEDYYESLESSGGYEETHESIRYTIDVQVDNDTYRRW
ncbi:hypothetical protein N7466_003517 [Penicillium verhagenii]|uniref:uncharacterized protein n=1 Tax=Penicillium verhagenii TaxID=1562060 RepID=UPI002544F627|nr:uncharacterized protein N7466_003517 [Penicillium verhagenii]KAJ5937067.1 hypothetical protein N7466_003517 [Penicillium verhagenii]